jgi:hypothetical protein
MGFDGLKKCQTDFFSNVIIERDKKGLYQDWETFLFRTRELWEKIKIDDFISWARSGLFDSLRINSTVIEENSTAIFRYLKIRREILRFDSKSLPFLYLANETKILKEEKKVINQKEWENWGYYISYFSRWKYLNKNKKITSLLEIIKNSGEWESLVDIYAIINQVEKKSEEAWILTLQDIRITFKLEIDKEYYEKKTETFTIHNELLFTCLVKKNKGKIIINLKNIDYLCE